MDILSKKLNKYYQKLNNIDKSNNSIYQNKILYYNNLIIQYGGLEDAFRIIKENILKINKERKQLNEKYYEKSKVDNFIDELLDNIERVKDENQIKLKILSEEVLRLKLLEEKPLEKTTTKELINESIPEPVIEVKKQIKELNSEPDKIINPIVQLIILVTRDKSSSFVVKIMSDLILLNKTIKLDIKEKLLQALPYYGLKYEDVPEGIRNMLDDKVQEALDKIKIKYLSK